MKKYFILVLLIFIGCGGGSSDKLKSMFKSNIVVADNKVIYMTLSSVVGMSDYIVGAYSKNYSSIISVFNPYKISYVSCMIDKEEIDYFVYKCDIYQYYCVDEFDCIQIPINKDKLLIIDKKNPTYLYEQSTLDNKKYILGEFNYTNGILSFNESN